MILSSFLRGMLWAIIVALPFTLAGGFGASLR